MLGIANHVNLGRPMSEEFVVEDQSAIAAYLGSAATHGGEEPARIDTHGAMVFLAKDRVYKVKRAVNFSYMDFSTREKRLAALQEEYRVNRRTAPDLYLGIAPLVQGPDGLCLGEIGAEEPDAVEHVLVMRRFEATFDEIAGQGGLKPEHVVSIAEQAAALHKNAEPYFRDDPVARVRAAVGGAMRQARKNPEILAPDLVDRVDAGLAFRVGAAAATIRKRSEAGLERHCHGDLHLRNICLFQGKPTLFDAIEFNFEFARIDLLYDLAFLLMDLEGRGLRPLANLALNTYLDRRLADGWPDEAGISLLPLFISLRAAIRAEVAANMANVQGSADAAAAQARDAADHLVQAKTALHPPPPRLVAVGGLSGSGKSTLAGALAPLLGRAPGARWLRSDVTRKALAGLGPLERLPPEAYTPEQSARTYRHLLNAAAESLAAGQAVVLDAVYARPGERFAIEALAARMGVPFTGIWLDAPAATRVERVDGRTADASDAGPEVAKAQSDYDLGVMRWQRLEAGGGAEAVLEEARNLLRL